MSGEALPWPKPEPRVKREPKGLRRTPMKRKPAKPSKRSADPVTPDVYATVMRRAEGACEIGPVRVTLGGAPAHEKHIPCSGVLHLHHRLPVGHGGPSTVENLLCVCSVQHSWAHGHPKFARIAGWIIDRRETDLREVPLRARDGWVVLTREGLRERVVVPAELADLFA